MIYYILELIVGLIYCGFLWRIGYDINTRMFWVLWTLFCLASAIARMNGKRKRVDNG